MISINRSIDLLICIIFHFPFVMNIFNIESIGIFQILFRFREGAYCKQLALILGLIRGGLNQGEGAKSRIDSICLFSGAQH